MEALGYLVVAVALVSFALVSARAERTFLTPPMAFVAFGWAASALGLVEFSFDTEIIHLLAQLALVLILFTDASRIDLVQLWRFHRIPVRLLAFGLPATMVLGALAAAIVLDGLNVWQAVLVGIILAPTDAALGQAVVSSARVPLRVRQALNVESGLNDGIALPFLLVVLAAAMSAGGITDPGHWVVLAAKQILLGPAIGAAAGFVGAKLLQKADAAGWVSEVFLKLSAIGLALLAFGAAELAHGNGFIAAFAAGLVMGNVAREICPRLYEFGEAEGQLLALLTFMIFGGLIPELWPWVSGATVVYAVLSLTAVRMIPVAISLTGMKLSLPTVLFLGWFGPRGIASILYALLVVGQSDLTGLQGLLAAVMLTVLLSVLLHGATAVPGVAAYALATQRLPADALEHSGAHEMPLRIPCSAASLQSQKKGEA